MKNHPTPHQPTPVAVLGLTPRQTAVLEAVWRCLPDKLIADELHMSVATVRAHLAQIVIRLGLQNRPGLHMRVAAALRFEGARRRQPTSHNRYLAGHRE